MLAVAAAPLCALAQRSGDSIVSSASDAFGTTLGYDAIGLYSAANTRGFSPQQAGNLRIEGLYFDQQAWSTNPCLVHESAIRVGLAAQAIGFVSPTGVVDLKLDAPTDAAGGNLSVYSGPYDGYGMMLEAQQPLAARTSATACASYDSNFDAELARHGDARAVSIILRTRPDAETEIVPFWAINEGSMRLITPQFYTDGVVAPPSFAAEQLPAWHGSQQAFFGETAGLIVRHGFGHGRRLVAGLFRSVEEDPSGSYPEYLLGDAANVVRQVVDYAPALSARSTSGEIRLEQLQDMGHLQVRAIALLRGRAATRDFGGDILYDFGTVPFDQAAPQELPAMPPPRPTSIDETRQVDAGALIGVRAAGVGQVELSILRAHYQRSITAAQTDVQAPAASTRTAPWLPALALTFDRWHGTTLYASATQGLEDAAVAPVTATNRGEPPPATRTRQTDAGVQLGGGGALTTVAGMFEIRKAYFNLDASGIYRQLGTVAHRGIETSLRYGDEQFRAVTGAVFQRTRFVAEGGAAALGTDGLDAVPWYAMANLDYAPARWPGWSTSARWTYVSSRPATLLANRGLPPYSTFGAGIRYASNRGGHAWSVRLDAFNLGDARGLHLTNVGLATPELGRRFSLTLSIDR
jgi:iron complex outermembrane receptor protein